MIVNPLSFSTSLRHGRETSEKRDSRRLSHGRLAGYKPLTGIADQAKIDYDQAFIESMTEAGRLKEALQMYENGAFSQSIARLHLVNPDPPSMAIPEGTKVLGTTEDGLEIKGTLLQTIKWATNTEDVVLVVEYEATMQQTIYCHVGGLSATNARETDGCFSNEGTIKILDFQEGAPVYEYPYGYNPIEDTYNGRTLQSLSTGIDMTFGHSKHQEKYVRYYGAEDYADQWIQAAVNGSKTEFLLGNADFTDYNARNRQDVMLTAPKVLNVWMYVVRMMEYAVVRCDDPCGHEGGDRCDDVPVRAWDQAVGYYSGSLEGTDGQGKGVLLYNLADTMCEKFKTCSARGNHEKGTSSVNLRVIDLFAQGQLSLLRRECPMANDIKDQIVRLMSIPLIQATLLSSHMRNFTHHFEEVKGATYTASILPIVHECSYEDANEIFSNLGLGQSKGTVNALAVKNALENNYACMGITCEDIGGVWEGKYYGRYALPCNYESQSGSSTLLLVAVIVGFLIVPCLLLITFLYCRKKVCAGNKGPIYEEDINEAENAAESPSCHRLD